MHESKTKKSTRVMIIIIAFVMTVGFLGTYFLMMLPQSDPASTQTTDKADKQAKQNQTVDPTAYKVNGKVAKLEILDKKVGTGDEVKPTDTIRAHYKGTFAQSGVKFDSSYDRGEPITFPLADVIPGWQQGMTGMKVGGERRLIIPADLAYGAEGNTGIPPNTDLVFEVELLAINPPQ